MSNPADKEINLLILDREPVVLRGIGTLNWAQCGIALQVFSEFDDIKKAIEQLSGKSNQIIVLCDVLQGYRTALNMLKYFGTECKRVKLIVWSRCDESWFIKFVLNRGARGCISKSESLEKIISAVLDITQGKVHLGTGFSLAEDLVLGKSVLSNREFEIFAFIGEGLSVKDIAKMLHLSIKTVETHREKIKKKFRVKSSANLDRIATMIFTNGVHPRLKL